MAERLKRDIAIVGSAIALALGASYMEAAQESSPQPKPDTPTCHGGLPPNIEPAPKNNSRTFAFHFPDECRFGPLKVFSARNPSKVVGELHPGEPFYVACQNTVADPPSVLIQKASGYGQGLVHLSPAATREFDGGPTTRLFLLPPCYDVSAEFAGPA